MSNAFGYGYAIGQALQPFLSNAAGVILSNSASGKAFGRQLYAMERQAQLNYDYGQKTLKTSPSAQREGLENAGYNPMLAVGNATSGANSGWTSMSGVNMDEYAGNTMAQATNAQGYMNAISNREQTASNIATNLTQQQLNQAQASKVESETRSQDIHNKYLDSNEQKQLGKMDAEISKLGADTQYTNELKNNIKARMDLDREIANIQAASGITQAGIHANATRYASDVSSNTQQKIAREHMPSGKSQSFRNYTGGVNDVLTGIGSVIHGLPTHNEYNEHFDQFTYDRHGKMTGRKTQHVTRSSKSSKRIKK